MKPAGFTYSSFHPADNKTSYMLKKKKHLEFYIFTFFNVSFNKITDIFSTK